MSNPTGINYGRMGPGRYAVDPALACSPVLGQGLGATAIPAAATTPFPITHQRGSLFVLGVGVQAFNAGTFTGNGRLRVLLRRAGVSSIAITDWFNLTSAGITAANEHRTYSVPTLLSAVSAGALLLNPNDSLFGEVEAGAAVGVQPSLVRVVIELNVVR